MNKTPKKLKIAIVSDAVYPYNIGGKEKRIYELSTRLAKKGHQVTIYTMKWWEGTRQHPLGSSVTHEGVRFEAISPLYPLYDGERRSIKEAIMFALNCFKLITKDFDIIDADHMPHLILFPLKIVTILKRKKLFVTWNEVWGLDYWNKYLGKLGRLAYLIEKLSSLLPNEIISVSEHTTLMFKNNLSTNIPIHTIPLGIDINLITRLMPSKTKSDILFAGRLMKHKNIDVLIKSVSVLKKEFPHITCIIVGNGPEEFKLKQLVNKLELAKNIKFYKFLKEHNQLYSLMKSSKIFVFPSTREGFGLAAIEANAAGIAVITTNHKNNATTELISNGINGSIVDLDKNSFAASIKYYITTKSDSGRHINFARKYDWSNLVDKVEKVYLS